MDEESLPGFQVEFLEAFRAVEQMDWDRIDEARGGASLSSSCPPSVYRNPDVPAYEEIRWQRKDRPDHETFLERLDTAMDRYTVS